MDAGDRTTPARTEGGRRLVHSTSGRPGPSGNSGRGAPRPDVAVKNLSVPETTRSRPVRSHGSGKSLRRLALLLGAVTVLVVPLVILRSVFRNADLFPAPTAATLAGLSVPQRAVAIAESQVGYSTEPSTSYCNKFSAYWNAGSSGCPSDEKSEEWCADFAAWVWKEAGVGFTYGYGQGEINGGAVSFYEWGVANGEWHPATTGFIASPGDVAVYGLSLGADPSAVHVAIVTGDLPGDSGPNVVNGDGDRTGFSVVETGIDQVLADAGNGDSTLAGYVSPP
jgi:hypothetical protein